jgi:low density lipoprotein-related protein 2
LYHAVGYLQWLVCYLTQFSSTHREYVSSASNDCHDNSDEKTSLCQREECPGGQFQCRNRQCIPYDVVCDGIRNCTDGSDEPSSCGTNMSDIAIECSHAMFVLGVNECASAVLSGCEHDCVNTLTSFRCTCRAGYKLAPNKKNCWGKRPRDRTVFTRTYNRINLFD